MRHLPMRHLLASLTLLGGATLLANTASAQETPAVAEKPTQTAPTTSADMPTDMPRRGSTMDTVRAKFGAPSQEVPAVGAPPISRWEYPGYVVFFEHDKVLHSVVK